MSTVSEQGGQSPGWQREVHGWFLHVRGRGQIESQLYEGGGVAEQGTDFTLPTQ